LTDHIDAWQQHLKDIEKVEALKSQSKAEQKESKIQFRDRQDDLLLRMNAKRALDATTEDGSETGDSSNFASSSRYKRQRQEDRIVVKIESDDKGLSKEDWKEIISTGGQDSIEIN
jgi:hypothetical protein